MTAWQERDIAKDIERLLHQEFSCKCKSIPKLLNLEGNDARKYYGMKCGVLNASKWLGCVAFCIWMFCLEFFALRFVGLWLCSCASTGLSALVVLRSPATWHRTHEALSDLADGRCRHCTGRVRLLFLQTRHVFEIRCISAFFVVHVFFLFV